MATAATASIYDTITNQIIAALERGTGDYTLPWHRSSASLTRPINAVILVATPWDFRLPPVYLLRWPLTDERPSR